VALSFSLSLVTMRGIGRGSWYGAESSNKTSTAESSFVESSVPVIIRAFSAHIGVGMGTSIPLRYTPFPFCPLPLLRSSLPLLPLPSIALRIDQYFSHQTKQ
jgi:hypothetical protein